MSPFTFVTLQYDSGDWDSAPLVAANVIDSLARYTNLEVAPAGRVVALGSPELLAYPFAFLTGHLPVRFTAQERAGLRTWLDRGGFLFVDDHNHDVDGMFHKTAMEELAAVAGPLPKLATNHPLYRAHFRWPDGPPNTSHELNGWGDNLVHDYLRGATRGGRLAVCYSNKDYSSEWNFHPDNKRFYAIDNTRFAVNLVVYALTH
ncbi:MAG: DUF4159 domain-containing protein [Gemmatimonadetes bacterium]|nr:DUF4159 domain-containing protein [Gemmatimonadota bacterium]